MNQTNCSLDDFCKVEEREWGKLLAMLHQIQRNKNIFFKMFIRFENEFFVAKIVNLAFLPLIPKKSAVINLFENP